MKKILKFFKYLIKDNPIKSTLTGILFICLLLAIHFNYQVPETHKVFSSFQNEGKFFYVILHDRTYTVYQSDKEIAPKNGEITYLDTIGVFYFFLIVVILIGIFLVLSLIIPDTDTEWNFKRAWHHVLIDDVECEFEDGIYYWIYKGKLLYQDDRMVDRNWFISWIGDYYKNGANIYPDFMTKSQRRDKKLKDLFQ